jgi:protein-tyrosine phosphatase
MLVAGTQPAAGTVDAMSTLETSRVITLGAVHNFRDLGGYPTEDGRVTRWRTLFRADGLHRLADDDLEVVRALGIHTVIDLRTHLELAERGTFPVDDHPVAFHHLPVIDVTWDPGEVTDPSAPHADFLLEKYLEMLDMGEPALAEAFRVLAVPGALPAVFHCAAGKDRTGLLAALVLSAVGVSDEDVVRDYALTEAAMVRMFAWFEEHNPEWVRRVEAQPSAFMSAAPGAMEGVLSLIRDVHGSTQDYLSTLGVSSVVLADLEDALLSAA